MNSITMNFDDTTDINIIYNQLKKQYPKIEIIKNDNPAIRAMELMQEAMAGEAERLGLHSEEDVIKWVEEVREEIWREKNK